jgi:uncharacterized membrane protein YhaH (DUF805 family)
MPVPFLFAGFVLMPRVMASSDVEGLLFGLLLLNNMVYLLLLLVLIVLLASPGRPDANRFGPPPV